MLKSLSIKNKLLVLTISTIFIVSSLISIKSIISISNLTDTNIEKFRADAYKQKEVELKNYISLAYKTVESYHNRTSKEKIKTEVETYLKEQSNLLFSILENQYNKYKNIESEAVLQNRLKEIVEATRYGNNGYFWINDFNSVILMHPIKKNLNGESKKGVKHWDEFVEKAKNGSGFVRYIQNLKGKKLDKISYVTTFKPFNWIIGTGSYIDDISDSMKKEALNAITQMKYSNNEYFWINNSKHIMLSHPKENLIGKNLYDFKDKRDNYIFRKFVEIANSNKNGGLVKYYWSKNDTQVEKFSYIKKFEPWDFIIGTGVYIDDIEQKITIMEKNAKEEIIAVISQTILIALIITAVLAYIVVLISNSVIVKPIENFQIGLLNFFKYLNRETNDVKEIIVTSNDEIGHMSEVVNKNIQNTKKLIEEDKDVIDEVSHLVQQISTGTLSGRVTKTSDNPAIKELIIVLNQMMDNLQEIINHSLDVLKQYQNNDFRVSTTVKCTGEICDLMNGIDDLGNAITQMLIENKQKGNTLNTSANELLSNVSILNESSQESATAIEETSSALQQITANIKNNVDNINQMSNLANTLKTSSNKGQELANKTTNAMDNINEQVVAINDAITIIDQISFQTNILSLNAAVEAATAGEAGKGFAVVAQEVRNLASKSAEAAKEIKDLVESATNKANEGKETSDIMIDGFNDLNENINKTIVLMNDISTASLEQRTGIEQINSALMDLDRQTQNNVKVATQTQKISNQTSDIAKEVIDNVNNKEFNGKEEAV